jgi:hypothetical protein
MPVLVVMLCERPLCAILTAFGAIQMGYHGLPLARLRTAGCTIVAAGEAITNP